MATAYGMICEKCGKDLTTHAYRIKDGKYKYFCSKECVGNYLTDNADIEFFDFMKGQVKQVWLMK